MKTKNKIYKISIDASGDSCEIFETENIPEELACKIFEHVYKNYEINEVSSNDYVGETVFIEGKYGSTKAKMTKVQKFFESKTEPIYEIDSGENNVNEYLHFLNKIPEETILDILSELIDNNLEPAFVHRDFCEVGCYEDYILGDMELIADASVLSWYVDISLHYSVEIVSDDMEYDIDDIPKEIWNDKKNKTFR